MKKNTKRILFASLLTCSLVFPLKGGNVASAASSTCNTPSNITWMSGNCYSWNTSINWSNLPLCSNGQGQNSILTQCPTLPQCPTGSQGSTTPQCPTVPQCPTATKCPTATQAPSTTKAPIVTQAPSATKAPTATKAPSATKAPTATKVPTATQAPVVTQTPSVTQSPSGSVTEQSAYATLNSLRSTYPEGMRLTNSYYYYSPKFGNGYGCYGFAAKLSDTVFGTQKSYQRHTSFDQIKVGDNIRIGNSHSVIVLTKAQNSITVVEGNYNSSVHWDRTITRNSLSSSGFTVYTRY